MSATENNTTANEQRQVGHTPGWLHYETTEIEHGKPEIEIRNCLEDDDPELEEVIAIIPLNPGELFDPVCNPHHNAERLIACWNSHDALVEALKEALSHFPKIVSVENEDGLCPCCGHEFDRAYVGQPCPLEDCTTFKIRAALDGAK